MGSVFYERREENVFAGCVCDHPFPSHVHDVVEIVCLLEGSITMTIANKQMKLLPGDIAVVFPVIPHSYDVVSEDAAGVTLIFAPDTIIEFYHTFRTMQPQHPMLPSFDKAPELEAIIALLDQNTPLKLGYLHLFLSYLFTCLPVHLTDRPMHSGTSYQVL